MSSLANRGRLKKVTNPIRLFSYPSKISTNCAEANRNCRKAKETLLQSEDKRSARLESSADISASRTQCVLMTKRSSKSVFVKAGNRESGNCRTWKVAGTLPSSFANMLWYAAAVASAVSRGRTCHRAVGMGIV